VAGKFGMELGHGFNDEFSDTNWII